MVAILDPTFGRRSPDALDDHTDPQDARLDDDLGDYFGDYFGDHFTPTLVRTRPDRHLRLVVPQPFAPSRHAARRRVEPGTRVAPPRTHVHPARRAQPARATLRSDRAGAGLYWRRRLAAVGLIVAGAVVVTHAGSVLGRFPLASSGHHPRVVAPYVVQPGETLWSIAGDRLPSMDRRAAVDLFRDHVGGTEIYAGQSIAIPSED